MDSVNLICIFSFQKIFLELAFILLVNSNLLVKLWQDLGNEKQRSKTTYDKKETLNEL